MAERMPRAASAALAGLSVLGAIALYLPWGELGSELAGLDRPLHASRIEVARDALEDRGAVPAWSTREFLGAPFSANLHSFPLIPTRLAVLLLAEGMPHLAGVVLAAALAALFTWLLCRELRLTPVGAAIAAWTFAASGFFSSRVLAGHLTLLEAYPALPLLLWLALRGRSRRGSPTEWRWLAALALATTAVVLAGHPQLPAYAVATTIAFLLIDRRRGDSVRPILSMAFGIGVSLFAWIPMLQLVSRSTRVLDLAPATNDLALPWERLVALVRPDIHGYPIGHPSHGVSPFGGFPNAAYFWDTVGYVGLLPLVAVLGLGVFHLVRRQRPTGPLAILATLSLAALALSLPWASGMLDAIPGTLLRSPSRLLYIPTLGVAVATGFVMDRLAARTAPAHWPWAAVAAIVAAHVLDLGAFSRSFVEPAQAASMPQAARVILGSENDQRAAVDRALGYPEVAAIDDVSVFDSILLATTYEAMFELSDLPATTNVQYLDGSTLSVLALQRAAVSHVLTIAERPDLREVASFGAVTLYQVPDPLPRASFHSPDDAVPVSEGDPWPGADTPPDRILLPHNAMSDVAMSGTSTGNVVLSRPSHDHIRIDVTSTAGGWVRVIESWDPGWSASIDGVPAHLWRADGYSLGIAVPPGSHQLDLAYRTPGRRTGGAAAAAALSGLAWYLHRLRSANRTTEGQDPVLASG